MKANEFVKKFGWEVSIKLSNEMVGVTQDVADCVACWGQSEWDCLKRLVESWELVESYKSKFGEDAEWFFISEYCKKNRISPFFSENYNKASSIYKQAIADMESCQ